MRRHSTPSHANAMQTASSLGPGAARGGVQQTPNPRAGRGRGESDEAVATVRYGRRRGPGLGKPSRAQTLSDLLGRSGQLIYQARGELSTAVLNTASMLGFSRRVRMALS